MRLKSLMLLVVAAGGGLLAMLLFQQATRGGQGPVQDQKVKVLVALGEIAPGQSFDSDNVEFRSTRFRWFLKRS